MKLQNCKITIEPKGEPENTVVFFNADFIFDDSIFTGRAGSMSLPYEMNARLTLKEDPECKNPDMNVGFFGYPP
jgi:hypothetical protein